MDDLVGKKLGKYEVENVLGTGGMASVYRARDTSLGRIVAIKVLEPSLAEDPIAVERFNREAITAARLQHPNIVAIYDVRQEGPYYYIAMRFVPGETLRDIITRDAPLTLQRTIQLIRPVAEALDYAHSMGIVHRDIKPGNIIVNPRNNEVALTDFGIARAHDQSHLTAVGMVMGTADYLSPEQVRGEEATASSDNYALGIVAYELLTGNPPFFDKAVSEVLRAQLNEPPPPLNRFNPALPAGVQQVIDRALAKKPADRFATAIGMVEALTAVAQYASSRAPAPTARPAPVAPNRNQPPPAYQQPVKPATVSRSAPPTSPAARRLTPARPRPQAARSNAGLWVAFIILLLLIGGLIFYLLVINRPANSTGGNSGNSGADTATPTAIITSAYTGPTHVGNGLDLAASRDNPAPSIDGDIAEWIQTHPRPLVINQPANLRSGLPRSGKWGGVDDLSGVCYVAWDNTNFYFAASVVDNVHVQTQSGSTIFKGDHIELWFDTDLGGDFTATSMDADDYQIGLSPGDFASLAPAAYIWSPPNTSPSAIKVAAKTHGTGYTLEAAIPWTTLNFQPTPGAALGFDIDLSDTDTPGAAQQEQMLSSSPNRAYDDPTSWGNLFLR